MTHSGGSFVIGTAGHVDHGKTSLVRALTGVDTDRLPEEKLRGISLELGFAPLSLPSAGTGSVIDVPGHERLVRTMIRGAGALDVVLMVVAANEGIMPQTREHLTICALLAAGTMVVALTKMDLVDAETLALARLEVEELIAGGPFEDAAIVACSSTTGAGLEELRVALAAAAGGCESDTDRRSGPALLPVDRAFNKAGFGTIVTGTLVRGALTIGDEIDLLTSRGVEQARIRGLQTHGASVTTVEARARVAVNVGPTEAMPSRTGALGARGSLRPTSCLVATLEQAVPRGSRGEESPRRGRVSLHLGVDAVEATFSTLRGGSDDDGPPRLFLTLSRPLLAWTGDRFVLRQPTPRGLRTVGGGRVLDPHPTRSRRRLRHDPVAHDETALARVARIIEEAGAGGYTMPELEARLVPGEDVRGALAKVAVNVASETPTYVGLAVIDRLERTLIDRVGTLHREHPALAGHPMAQVMAGQPAPRAAAAALSRLEQGGVITRRDGLIATTSHRATPGAESALASLSELYRTRGLMPPHDAEALATLNGQVPRPGDLLVELRRRRAIVRVPPFHMHTDATDLLLERLSAFFLDHAALGAADLKVLGGGLSRKYAIPLLEWLDARGITRRQGELHLPAPDRARR